MLMEDLQTFLNILKPEILMIYGKAGTGKTTLASQLALQQAQQKKKVLFLDTEGGFSVDRLQQMAGEEWATLLDQIVVMRVQNFTEQYDRVSGIVPLMAKFGLVVVDTIGHYYRQELKKDATATNKLMDRQLHVLFEISKKVPVLLTNQVYGDVINHRVASIGGNMILKWCQTIIELQNDPRMLIMRKPEEKKQLFTIATRGVVFS